MMPAFWSEVESDEWSEPVTCGELSELLVHAGYTADFMAVGRTIVVAGPEEALVLVESVISLDGEHLYKCRAVAA